MKTKLLKKVRKRFSIHKVSAYNNRPLPPSLFTDKNLEKLTIIEDGVFRYGLPFYYVSDKKNAYNLKTAQTLAGAIAIVQARAVECYSTERRRINKCLIALKEEKVDR